MRERESPTRCLALLGSGVVVAAVLLVGAVLAVTLVFSGADTANQSPSSGDEPLRIVALGDGFISGEGGTRFFPGTDKPGRNQCRRTSTSFPYLVANTLEPPPGYDGVSLISVACSGAATTNVASFDRVVCTDAIFPDGCPGALYPHTADGRRESRAQVEAVTEETDVVLLMVGAKDAQLRDTIALCVVAVDPCASTAGPFVDAMGPMLEWRIGRVLAEARQRAPAATLIALTYPSLLGGRYCGSSRLDQDATEFIDGRLQAELNRAITRAASNAGARLIDLSQAFGERRLCSAGATGTEPAAAAFQVRPMRAVSTKPSAWFHGSFHPNELGHRLMGEVVTTQLSMVLREPPATTAQESTAPVRFAAGPAETVTYAHRSACTAAEVVLHETIARPADDMLPLAGRDAGTQVCLRNLGAGWRTIGTQAPAAEVRLPAGRGGLSGWSEVLYRANGEWTRIVVVTPSGPGTAELPLARAWAWPWLVTAGDVIAHPVIAVTLIAMALGGALMWCMRRPRPPRSEAPRVLSPRTAR